MTIGSYYQATFHRQGFPDLGPVPVAVSSFSDRAIKELGIQTAAYHLTWPADLQFDDGAGHTSAIDELAYVRVPGITRTKSAQLSPPSRNPLSRTATAYFRVE